MTGWGRKTTLDLVVREGLIDEVKFELRLERTRKSPWICGGSVQAKISKYRGPEEKVKGADQSQMVGMEGDQEEMGQSKAE